MKKIKDNIVKHFGLILKTFCGTQFILHSITIMYDSCSMYDPPPQKKIAEF